MNLAKAVTHRSGILFLVFFLFISRFCLAQPDQCTPSAGQFTGSLQISPGIGCMPLKITATSGLRNVTNVRYVYDYQGGAVKDADLIRDSVFTYQKPGLFRVLQYSEQDGRQLRVCAIVQVYDTLPPELVVTGCQTRVMVTIPKSAEYQYNWYRVDWGDGTQEQLDGASPMGVHTYADDNQRVISVRGVHLYGNCGGTTRVSFRPDTKAITPVIDKVHAVGANSINLTISNPGGNRFRIEQRSPGGTYVQTSHRSDAVNATVRLDADTTVAVCFRLILADTCLQAAPSAEVCYTPPKPPEPAPVPDSTVFMPDAFSPNADGINDQWQLQGLLSGKATLTIFNRWGEVVFLTDDALTGWDGKQQGKTVPPGTYSYRLDQEKPDGRRFQKRGVVVLVP
ncbi:gliding motility-associated C-terminal domain-containing protein [Larkinella sp. GY13]|uniref:gliding motility-associated C-terminal domain-containing protein n=1 Tax=Larkinella sp. GY13 TaxID=3453720 RepID=UPI003EEB2701